MSYPLHLLLPINQINEKSTKMSIERLDSPEELKPCYYNTGCALYSDGVTGIEISEGIIKLVKWDRNQKAQFSSQAYQEGAI